MAEFETSREVEARIIAMKTREEFRPVLRSFNAAAERALRPLLKRGDKLRATKAECGSHEASFVFSGWSGGWIVSTGGSSIAPGSVYSVNRQVMRYSTAIDPAFIEPLEPVRPVTVLAPIEGLDPDESTWSEVPF